MNIKEIAKTMTREDFIRTINCDGNDCVSVLNDYTIVCPCDTNLKDNCFEGQNCMDCWVNAIKNIEFMGEGEMNKEFTKSDLKNGMVIETREGIKYLVVGTALHSKNTWFPIESLKEDLKSDDESRDIMKVYKDRYEDCFYAVNAIFGRGECCSIDLIWERKEVDWSKVEVDTKLLVSRDSQIWYKRYFAMYEDNKVVAFNAGKTSFTNNEDILKSWNYAKLWSEEKLLGEGK